MNGGLTDEARSIIRNELSDYVIAGDVTPWVGEVKPEQSALAHAERMKYTQEIVIAPLALNTSPPTAIAFTMHGQKSDGRREYLVLPTHAHIKTPQNCQG